MDGISGFTIIAVAIGLLVIWGFKRLTKLANRRTGGDTEGAAVDLSSKVQSPTTSDGRDIYQIADAANDAFHDLARPEDLDSNRDFNAGVSLLASSNFNAEDVANYFCGDSVLISCMAARALRQRDDGPDVYQSFLFVIGTVATWPLIFGLEYLTEAVDRGTPIIGPVVGQIHGYFYDRQARTAFDQFVKSRIAGGEKIEFSDHLKALDQEQFETLRTNIGYLSGEVRDALFAALDTWSGSYIDVKFLKSVGKVQQTTAKDQIEIIVEHESLLGATGQIKETILSDQPRSVLLVGEAGVGKSTAISLVTRDLINDGWTVFQAGHNEIMAGQTYIGQLEKRVQELIDRLGNRRKILWIVPDFHQLVFAGVHKYSGVSVLDAIAPAIERADIRLIGTTTVNGFKLATKQNPALATLLSVQRMEPIGGDQAKPMALEALEQSEGKQPEHAALVEEAWELAQQYVSNISAPGNLFKLLALAQVKGLRENSNLTVALLHETLSELTGLPVGILDDRKPLDIDGLQQAFSSRVLGQKEAIKCLVERVAMMKAGLTDPTRPAGVFFFAGPTGTGKTELAKTLAEWLFSSPDRLLRYDMSEFQTPGDLEQMLGGEGHESHSIVTRLTERPFSVILLDEFEKAHSNVWDLFLQVFDDGRLTDRQGRTADFRHTIIIMTSNLGATIPTGMKYGFVGGSAAFDDAGVLKNIEKTFRKEFINRFDRIVVFKPLTKELMRSILEIELQQVQTRRGFRSKPWAVEWDESAIDFLLEKGFTPDMGARPLKRAIDQYLLSPLSLTIVRHEAPAGDQFLFVTREDGKLDVRFVDPDITGDTGEAVEPPDPNVETDLTAKSITRSPVGNRSEIIALRSCQANLRDRLDGDDWLAIKSDSYSHMQDPDFWQNPNRFEILDRIERLGRVDGALSRATSLLDRMEGQLTKGRDRYRVDLIGSLAQTLFLLKTAVDDIVAGKPSDAILLVRKPNQKFEDGNEAADFYDEIVAMYDAWAKKRRMTLRVLKSEVPSASVHSNFLALISGFGAHTLLAGENGLHVLDHPQTKSSRAKKSGIEVRVGPQPYDLANIDDGALAGQCQKFLNDCAPKQPAIVRHYKRQPAPMVRDLVTGWRTGNIDRVLGGDFDLI